MSIIHTVSNFRGSPTFELEHGDLCVVREIFQDNVYRFIPRPNWRVLDIGAHKGIFSVYAALMGAQVYAYEPNPPSYAMLLENIFRNKVEHLVDAHNLGVWSAPGTLFLNQNQANSGGSSIFSAGQRDERGQYVPSSDERDGGVLVPVISWEDAIGNATWDLVKLDAEGIEFELLCNATQEQLKRIKHLAVEVHNDLGTDSQYQTMIRNLAVVFNITGVAEPGGKLNYIYATSRW